jgi:Ca2+-transporting ATPase
MEPLEGDEMQRQPIPSVDPLLTLALISRMAIMTPTIVAVTLGWFTVRSRQGVPFSLLQSETFTVLAVCQWFNVLNCRSTKRSAFSLDIFKNYWLVGGLIISVLLQFAVIYWPPLNRLFHTTPIALTEFFAIGAAASIVLWVEELRKLIVRSREKRVAPRDVSA